MHEEDLKMMQQAEDILEKELRAEIKKVVDAGQFAPGQTKTLSEAVCLMLEMKEYEEWLNGEGISDMSRRSYARSYANPMRYSTANRYVSYGPTSYNRGFSGHSTKDRMIALLEDMMGEVHNEYEAQMVSDVISYIQSGH